MYKNMENDKLETCSREWFLYLTQKYVEGIYKSTAYANTVTNFDQCAESSNILI